MSTATVATTAATNAADAAKKKKPAVKVVASRFMQGITSSSRPISATTTSTSNNTSSQPIAAMAISSVKPSVIRSNGATSLVNNTATAPKRKASGSFRPPAELMTPSTSNYPSSSVHHLISQPNPTASSSSSSISAVSSRRMSHHDDEDDTEPLAQEFATFAQVHHTPSRISTAPPPSSSSSSSSSAFTSSSLAAALNKTPSRKSLGAGADQSTTPRSSTRRTSTNTTEYDRGRSRSTSRSRDVSRERSRSRSTSKTRENPAAPSSTRKSLTNRPSTATISNQPLASPATRVVNSRLASAVVTSTPTSVSSHHQQSIHSSASKQPSSSSSSSHLSSAYDARLDHEPANTRTRLSFSQAEQGHGMSPSKHAPSSYPNTSVQHYPPSAPTSPSSQDVSKLNLNPAQQHKADQPIQSARLSREKQEEVFKQYHNVLLQWCLINARSHAAFEGQQQKALSSIQLVLDELSRLRSELSTKSNQYALKKYLYQLDHILTTQLAIFDSILPTLRTFQHQHEILTNTVKDSMQVMPLTGGIVINDYASLQNALSTSLTTLASIQNVLQTHAYRLNVLSDHSSQLASTVSSSVVELLRVSSSLRKAWQLESMERHRRFDSMQLASLTQLRQELSGGTSYGKLAKDQLSY